MIQINLLPEELKKKESRLKKQAAFSFKPQDLPVLKILALAFGALLAVQILAAVLSISAKSGLKALDAKYAKISPEKQEADNLKMQADAIDRKMKTIDELMVKRFSWAEKLNSLSDSMTPGVWLTTLSYEEKVSEKVVSLAGKPGKSNSSAPAKPVVDKSIAKYLILSGYAVGRREEGTASVGKFIESLQKNASFYSDFSGIELGMIKRELVDGQEAMSFRIVCLFKKG